MKGKLILALDTATPAGSVALVDEERTLVSRYFDVGLQHSQRLFVEVEDALKVAGCTFAQVGAIAVSIGPGSFTGLRIGLSAAKGFCLAGALPLVTVSTLEVLAARLPFARYPVCPMLDARKSEVYTALYDTSAGWPRLLEAPRALVPQVLMAERAGIPTLFTGDGALAYSELVAACPQAMQAPFPCSRPEAAVLGWLAQARLKAGEVADLVSVEPEYLRGPGVGV
ncbi:MAG: tRNA (adenosine(37)-N6)-threonylcarbamoyltransferase complex dimerization subunit type 1 TsaB [Candidatus Latescibacteria bacterium]|nr:tRNA (adenosine(37)-N6)-threonylcarbamoyltransferase complex dimerization subunit type 1 TsaB [Candidatus Latescibacterota bacterium]